MPSKHQESFGDILRERAERCAQKRAFTFDLPGRDPLEYTYSALHARASAFAAVLSEYAHAGDRVLLMLPTGPDYVAALFGCLCAGMIAVPCGEVRSDVALRRWSSVGSDAEPAAVVIESAGNRIAKELPRLAGLGGLRIICADEVPADAACVSVANPKWDDIAFLQYTSGSTSSPKGVMVSHGNLVHNSAAMQEAFQYSEESECVSWLPLFHDMGLIGGILQPVYGGFPCTVMAPSSFAENPMRWLQSISARRATISGGPTFAYDLCVRRAGRMPAGTLDLSSWTTAFIGAEPVRADVLKRFAECFGAQGFRRESLRPCYGLAEATLIVSTGAFQEETGRFSSCGRTVTGVDVMIANLESGARAEPGASGEICVHGPSVARGYWNKPEDTRTAFRTRVDERDRRYLRTGDLGRMDNGELRIDGRMKDVVICRGRNHHASEIEASVASRVVELDGGRCAAFAWDGPGGEELAITVEAPRAQNELPRILAKVSAAIVEDHEIEPAVVFAVKRGAIPKTTSGKTKRGDCRFLIESGALVVLAQHKRETSVLEPERGLRAALLSIAEADRLSAAVDALRRAVSSLKNINPDDLVLEQPLHDLGIDSFDILQLQHWATESFGTDTNAAVLLGGASLERYAAEIVADLGSTIEPVHVEVEHRLSPNESSVWIDQRLDGNRASYNLGGAIQFSCGLDEGVLERALHQLAVRHPALRTCYPERADGPIRSISQSSVIDFSVVPAGESLTSTLEAEAFCLFDLSRGPLWRVRLLRSRDGDTLLVVVHHIIFDLASLDIFLRDLGELYEAGIEGRAASLSPNASDYAQYTSWRWRTLERRDAVLRAYWRDRLKGATGHISSAGNGIGASKRIATSGETNARLRDVARATRVTLPTLLTAAAQAFLHRWYRTTDLLIGTPLAGRSRKEWSGVIGCFVNMAPLRSSCDLRMPFADFARQTQCEIADANANQGYPLTRIVDDAGIPRASGRQRIFSATFSFQAAPSGSSAPSAVALGLPDRWIRFGPLEGRTVGMEQMPGPFELSFLAAAGDKCIELALQYDTGAYAPQMASRLLLGFTALLEAVSISPATPIGDLPIADCDERAHTLARARGGFQRSVFENPIARFEQFCVRTPDATALICDDDRLSYDQLNQRANRLARYLIRRGAVSGAIIALPAERTTETIVALLAIWKLGAAYLPISTVQPVERTLRLVADGGVAMLIRTTDASPVLPEIRTVSTEADRAAIASEGSGDLCVEISPYHLAYIVYTSGSTGEPNGVAVPWRALSSFSRALYEAVYKDLGSGPFRVSLNAPLHFDASVQQLVQLFAGHALVVVPEDKRRDPEELAVFLESRAIDVFDCTPLQLSALTCVRAFGRLNRTWKAVLVGGESIPPSLWSSLAQIDGVQFVNMYGPTECTVDATCRRIDAGSRPNIGQPLPNACAYVVDERLELAPTGVYGELCIAGDGLAVGYKNRPALTAERFVPDPMSDEPGSRMYRTGDIVRRMENGDIEYTGRADHQVKIRGHRVELGEIERQAQSCDWVKEAVVVVRGADAAQRLDGYVTAKSGETPSVESLRKHLRERLPDYMLPSRWIVLDCMPLNRNGKLDRNAVPERSEEPASSCVSEPRTTTERRILQMWRDVLRRPDLGLEEDFFECGGNSLLAAQVMARIRDAWPVSIPLRRIFEQPYIPDLALAVETEFLNSLIESEDPRLANAAARLASLNDEQVESLLAAAGRTEIRQT